MNVQFALATERLTQLNDVIVLQHSQDFNLAQRCLPHYFVIFALLELLDRHYLVGFLVATLQHHAVRAFPHDAQNLVLVHAAMNPSPTSWRVAAVEVREHGRIGSAFAMLWLATMLLVTLWLVGWKKGNVREENRLMDRQLVTNRE